MIWPTRVILLYGALDIISGVEGYMAAGKMPWLIWNVAFGLIVLSGLLLARSRPRLGFGLCALIGFLDAFFYGRRLMKSSALWPDGVIAVAAVTALTCAIIAIFAIRNAPHET